MTPTRLAAAAVLGLVVLAPALFAATGSGASSLSPALADAPAGLVTVAFEAGQLTGIDGNVLLAIAKVECDYGRCRSGQPDDLVPDDVRAHVDAAALLPGGAIAALLGLPDGRRIGDWVNPQPVADGEHAMGLMQFLPSTWRTEAAAASGRPQDPYRPADVLLTAGSYLHRLELNPRGASATRSAWARCPWSRSPADLTAAGTRVPAAAAASPRASGRMATGGSGTPRSGP